ncbi:3'-5' exonuclease [Listeria sp. ILCC792]|uniref:3'-5' exonuclease n=1 Tax=Listeria sp. ILCC792 TaxID=1918331 RepID=UPI000B5894EB|nr:3'-5' exonuclease [Listeria sp. ILCC792]
MNQLNYCMLDFETANGSRTSPCSIGIVKVENGQIRDTFYSLINPEEPFYRRNIEIHGIYPDDVLGAPTFQEIYPFISEFIGTTPVTAHFASFDISVFRKSAEKYQLILPENDYFCSCILSQQILPLKSHRLNQVADYFGIYFNHHNALDDSKAAAEIVLKLAEIKEVSTVPALINSIGYRFGQINGANFAKV